MSGNDRQFVNAPTQRSIDPLWSEFDTHTVNDNDFSAYDIELNFLNEEYDRLLNIPPSKMTDRDKNRFTGVTTQLMDL